jgi:phage-related protein
MSIDPLAYLLPVNFGCILLFFLHSFQPYLHKKMRTKMLRTISILADNGTELREPYSKPLGDCIFELRAKAGSDISRVLYFFFVERRVIITNGFVKKHRKHFLLK